MLNLEISRLSESITYCQKAFEIRALCSFHYLQGSLNIIEEWPYSNNLIYALKIDFYFHNLNIYLSRSCFHIYLNLYLNSFPPLKFMCYLLIYFHKNYYQCAIKVFLNFC